jgi:hypothetical protein
VRTKIGLENNNDHVEQVLENYDEKQMKNIQIIFTYSQPICKPPRPNINARTAIITHQDLYVQHEP